MSLRGVFGFFLAGRFARGLEIGALVGVVALAAGCNTVRPTVPARIETDAQPNGIAVRPADGSLFITDDRGNAILWSRDRATWTPYASLPAVAGQASSLSQLVFVRPDTLLVARFGFGSAGALFVASATGGVHALAGLTTDRRRVGLVSIGPGRALSSWFVKQTGQQPPAGGVSLVTYDASMHTAVERDLIAGLAKPVGIAVHGDALFVTDQQRGEILRYDLHALLDAPAPTQGGTVIAKVESPDLLAVDRSGALYTKCHAHGFCRVAPDGTVTRLADDFHDARGVALDDARHLLYVVDRAKRADGAASSIRVFTLDGGDAPGVR